MPMAPGDILWILKDPANRFVQQLVLLFKSILDGMGIRASKSVETGAVDIIAGMC